MDTKIGWSLQLWVEAGIPPHVALQAATHNAAILLRAENRIGSIRPGNDADLLLVNVRRDAVRADGHHGVASDR